MRASKMEVEAQADWAASATASADAALTKQTVGQRASIEGVGTVFKQRDG